MGNQKKVSSAIFDLDGVITKTATVHSHAWKATFDEYLQLLEKRDGKPFKPFTYKDDYLPFVDGKPRYEGVQSFLESRDVFLDHGDVTDAGDKETVCGIGNRKNEMFREILNREKPEVFQSSVDLIKELKDKHIGVGVASSSKNCEFILKAAGFDHLFETRIDGVNAVSLGLKGKPEGDIFIRAALDLNQKPEQSVVFEDATSGVAAGRNGGFGLVIGVAREDNSTDLFTNGADIVVKDLKEISLRKINHWFSLNPFDIMNNWEENSQDLIDSLKNLQVEVNPLFLQPGKQIFSEKKKVIVFNFDYINELFKLSDPEILNKKIINQISCLSKDNLIVIISVEKDVKKLFDQHPDNIKFYHLQNSSVENDPYKILIREVFNNLKIEMSDYVPVFLGGSKVDEESFRFLNTRGMTIKIVDSIKESSAKYFIHINEVADFLDKIC